MTTLRETGNLIAGNEVAGTAVYNTAGQNIGEIEGVMIDKPTGEVAYAVMSFGDFLGIDDRHHPLPWSLLNYDTGKGGYVVKLSRRQLEEAPAYADREAPDWGDRTYESALHAYYRTNPYWYMRSGGAAHL